MIVNITGLSTKKHGSNPSQKINHNLIKIPWNWMLQKNLLRLGKINYLKRNPP